MGCAGPGRWRSATVGCELRWRLNQEVERIALLMGARAQYTGDDRLRRGAARRAVPPADLPRHDGRADRLFRLPVGRFDVGAAQAREERGPLGPETLEDAAVRRMRDAAGEDPVGARLDPVAREVCARILDALAILVESSE